VAYELQAGDEFDTTSALGPQWFFHTLPDQRSYSLAARAGWLRAHPTADPLATTFLQTVREKAFEIETLVEFQPHSEHDRAGLILYHDPARHVSLALVGGSGSANVEIRKRSEGQDSVVASSPARASRLRLKIRVEGQECATFHWSSDGAAWRQLPGEIHFGDSGDPDLGWIGRDKRNTWTGAAFGVFAEGTTAADFGWFRVRRLIP
jgi:beta-xylosidase